MPKFPVDAPKARVLRALEALGFRLIREGNHISMQRQNSDGATTPLTMPNDSTLKASTLRTMLTQAGIPRRLPGRIRKRLRRRVQKRMNSATSSSASRPSAHWEQECDRRDCQALAGSGGVSLQACSRPSSRRPLERGCSQPDLGAKSTSKPGSSFSCVPTRCPGVGRGA
jgi:predicted RNA binding protein YcfA (HicA-like mRNA interferase family)